jgi:DNA-binding CsgD family transcriptional regulator
MLLEREKELGALFGVLSAACDGEGSFVLVEGGTGVGKSQLLRAAEDRAFELDVTTLAARGTELDRDLPFGVVVQLLELLITALPAAEREDLLAGPARLARPLFPALRQPGADAAHDPLALVHGTYWLIARIAGLRPLLVLVDDAQWCDERSLQVLRYLAARVEDLPVALVVARTGGPAELDRAMPALRMKLSPLSPSGVTQMVRSEFPDADAAFCAGCARATAGVPLLLSELLASVRNEGLPPVGATSDGFSRLGLREVARAVLARLDALPSGTPALARTAAVLGDDAGLHHTARLAGVSLHAAAAALDALCSTGIVEPDETIRFRHPIVRSALEASVPPAGRARTHLRAAHVLLGEAAPPERVAGHLLLAERGGRRWVIETLRRAAARAMSDGAPASAARCLVRALDEPPADPATEAELKLELARAEAAAGSPRAAARIRAALEPVGAADARTRVLADLVQAPAGGDRPAMLAAFEQALRLAGEGAGDPEALRWLEAMLLVEAREDPVLRRRARARLGARGDGGPSTPAGRALSAQRALEAALSCAPAVEVRALAARAMGRGALLAEDRPGGEHIGAAIRALTLADELQSAELAAARAVQRARDSGSPSAYARMCALRADISQRRGSLADAVADARAALDGATHHRDPAAAAVLALASAEHGDFGEAADALAALPAADAGSHPAQAQAPAAASAEGLSCAATATLLTARARLRRLRGEHAGAAADALAAGELVSELHADAPAWLPWRAEAALALAVSDPAAARRLAQEHLELARRSGAPRAVGVALGVVGITRGGADAPALLREAVGVLQTTHAALEHAHALAALGTALRGARDPVAARAPLREALAIARRCGAAVLEAKVHAELAASGDRVRRGELSEVESLSPVERRVVDLATNGLSADEVADALFVTVKAVEWHLRSASRKLGPRSRAQLLASLSLR